MIALAGNEGRWLEALVYLQSLSARSRERAKC
jgi:hypothetical protein